LTAVARTTRLRAGKCEPLRHLRKSVAAGHGGPRPPRLVDRRASARQAKVTATPRGGDRSRKRTGRSQSLACHSARKPPRLIAWVSTPLPRGTFGPGIRTSTRQGRFLRRKLKPPECRSAAVGRDASWLLRQSRFVHSPVLTGRRKMAYRCGLRVTPTRCRVHRERFMVGSFGSELG